MKRNNLLIVGAIIGAYFIYRLQRSSQVARSVQFSFDKLTVNVKNRTLVFVMGILNPASGSVTVKSVVGYIRVNGSDIASVETFQPVKVEGNKKSQLNLIIKPQGTGIVSLLMDLYKVKKEKGKLSANIQFVGNANVDGVTLPINAQLLDV